MSQIVAKQIATRKLSGQSDDTQTLPTFMDHIRELQGRLFAVVLTFLVIAGMAYPFFDKIANIILAPLKDEQKLVYLTPGGAFSFIIMVCAYVGIIGALPVIIFHMYRFVMPAVRKIHLRAALRYTIISLMLALAGILFAYFIMLPASLYFLTSFNLQNIDPMLTVDSYFSFVMTYLLAGAMLFQLPIVMLIINSVKPQTPKRLMHHQGHLLIGSFIVAAIISPTPDALNQTLLASPVVVMYQIGIFVIWLKNRKEQKRQRKTVRAKVVAESPVKQKAPVPAMPRVAPAPVPAAVRPVRRPAPVPQKPLTPKPAAVRPSVGQPSFQPAGLALRMACQAKANNSGRLDNGVRPPARVAAQPSISTRMARNIDALTPQKRMPMSPFSQPANRSIDGISVPNRA